MRLGSRSARLAGPRHRPICQVRDGGLPGLARLARPLERLACDVTCPDERRGRRSTPMLHSLRPHLPWKCLLPLRTPAAGPCCGTHLSRMARDLLDHVAHDELDAQVRLARHRGMLIVLAGSLTVRHCPDCAAMEARFRGRAGSRVPGRSRRIDLFATCRETSFRCWPPTADHGPRHPARPASEIGSRPHVRCLTFTAAEFDT